MCEKQKETPDTASKIPSTSAQVGVKNQQTIFQLNQPRAATEPPSHEQSSAPPSIVIHSNNLIRAPSEIPMNFSQNQMMTLVANANQQPAAAFVVQSQQQQPNESQRHSSLADNIENAQVFYKLPNGQIVSESQLIAAPSEKAANESTEFDEINASSDNDDTTFDDINDVVDGSPSLLAKIALKVVKIEANQKVQDKRLANIEKGISLLLEARFIDNSAEAAKSTRAQVNTSLSCGFKKIVTVDELKAFEEKLRNPAFLKEKVRTHFI